MSKVVPPKEPTSIKNPQSTITEMTRSVVSDAAKEVVKMVMDSSEKIDFNSAFEYYSNDPDARHVVNGYLYPSLAEMKESYNKMAPGIEYLVHTVKSWDIIVLSNAAAMITLPVHIKTKSMGRSEYEFDCVWSCLVEKRNNRWLIVQSHESWLNASDVLAAITPQ